MPDGVGVQPSRDEPQHRQRFRVQPLRIVDQADQRAFRRDIGQQRQRGQAHQESIGWRALRRGRTSPPARCGADRPAGPDDRDRAARADAAQRSPTATPIAHRQIHNVVTPIAESGRYCSRRVLPTPGSPMNTNEPLNPSWTLVARSSNIAHSSARPTRISRVSAGCSPSSIICPTSALDKTVDGLAIR